MGLPHTKVLLVLLHLNTMMY